MTRFAPLSIALAAACLAMAAQPSAAQPMKVHDVYSHDSSKIVMRTKIDFADLDLSTSAGVSSLLARIEDASTAVCRGDSGANAKEMAQNYASCRKAAIESAVHALGNPQLAALVAHPETQFAAK